MNRIALLLLALALVQSCHTSQEEKEQKQVLQNPKTVEVKYEDIPSLIEVTGFVEPDKDGIVKISPRVQGVIQSINVNVGDRVGVGEVLAVVKAPDITDIYAQKISLTAQLANAERLYKLKEELYSIGAIPKSEVMDAETNYKVLKAQLQGLEEKLKLLGGKGGISEVRSPVSGIVYQIKAHVGDSVDTSTEILSIARPSRVLISALVQDKDASKIRVGDRVEFSISTFPGKKYTGKVKYVSDVVDPETRTVKVYIAPDNVEDFRINMFFNVRIYMGKAKYAVIPESAILYKDGKFYVYVLENNKPILKEVSFIKKLEGKRVAVIGLEEGQRVITAPMLEEKP
ncbi:efflux RND transporter periplasmic adaptor subunit [Pampinifervens florentissimum]|uniref:efflux RND transporter periplasmic adaptor subunit n=1 Tax=Pampinifervens florentissimum TaxID=1632019 RepID=UPI0013B49302|nr:efflux RND transporter periplasmic adaptor subunit [Hydrogenobacter sp. T-8]QID32546.1 efflux RND transporter periplasmic adaptor subunit [Hydrogenobacter sp. T-8]